MHGHVDAFAGSFERMVEKMVANIIKQVAD